MNNILRNKWSIIAVLTLYSAMHASNAACRLGYCYCPKVVNHSASMDHGSDHHDNSEGHDHKSDHDNSDKDHNTDCCTDQHCCDSVSNNYLVKKAAEISGITQVDSGDAITTTSDVIQAYSKHVYSNRWVKCTALKYPPPLNYSIRVFIQSFLN